MILNEVSITIPSHVDSQRIDLYLCQYFPEFSRSYIQRLIKESHVLVGQKIVKSNYKIMASDLITIFIPEPKELNMEAENIPLNIIYEDDDLIIVNKPKDMVVHPAAGHESGTLVNALMYHCKGHLSEINGVLRPGIVHRIDKDTTGLLVVCKTNEAHMSISQQLKDHTITRAYHAIVTGAFKNETGTIDSPIGRHKTDRKRQAIQYQNGRHAITHYRVLNKLNGKFSYIECRLETGRTHQIRVHMSSIHHPILGDSVYGSKSDPFRLQGQVLHAKTLGFIHPRTGKYMEFEAPLPDYFIKLLTTLG